MAVQSPRSHLALSDRQSSDSATVANGRVLTGGQGWLARRHCGIPKRAGVVLGFEPQGRDAVGTLVSVVDVGGSGRRVRAGGRGRPHVAWHRAHRTGRRHHGGGVDAADGTGGGREAQARLRGHDGGEVRVDGAVHVHVQPPWEGLGAEGRGDLGGPVLVGIPRVQPVVKWRLHQAVELCAEACLEGLHVALAFSPLRPPVLEPDLETDKHIVRENDFHTKNI